MRSPLADAERERLIEALLPDVPFDGWSRPALRAGARRLGLTVEEAAALFPRGAPDMIAAFSRWADAGMEARMAASPIEPLGATARIRLAICLRLETVEPAREAVRRSLSVLAVPHNAPLGLRLLYETVDAMWRAAGDGATDFSFYTKRATLAGIYGATTLYWLDDRSEGFVDTRAFIDRRLADLGTVMRLRGRFDANARTLPNPLRLLRRSP